MKFYPIETAPKGERATDQILCRFWHAQAEEWVYMIAFPNGDKTYAPGYAFPEEWTALPGTPKRLKP